MAFTQSGDYAGLFINPMPASVAPGSSLRLSVDVTLFANGTRYRPETLYKLFIQLPEGLRKKSVTDAATRVHLTNFREAWSGGPGVSREIPIDWNGGNDARQQDAFNQWLLATWGSDSVSDSSVETSTGWIIELEVDSRYNFAATNNRADITAQLFAAQDSHLKTPLVKTIPIAITTAGPELLSVRLPEYPPDSSGKIVVATNTSSVKACVTLAHPVATKVQVEWQVEAPAAAWIPAGLVEVLAGGTQLADFTLNYDFTQPVTLRFRCATAGESNWGTPFSVRVDVASDLLMVKDPVISMISADKIMLTCSLTETSQLVTFTKLELSVDQGVSWRDITASRSGSSPVYSFSYDMTASAVKDRNFARGVYLRVTDNLQRQPLIQPARFDAASFLSATWDGASAVLDDINVGEALTYSVHLHCASGVVLPPATLSLQLADAAVEADSSARSWYWMMDETSGEPKGAAFDSAGWRGTAVASQIYRGPIQSGLVSALARVRSDEALLGKTLPPASLTIAGSEFFVSPFVSVEPVRAKVWQPAPYFQFVNMALHTNKLGVILRGDFIPPVEPSAALTFTACIDEGVAHPVTPSLVTTNQFELKLDPAVFTAFEHNGSYSVQLAVRRSADTRPDERSSHRATLALNINNSELITGS